MSNAGEKATVSFIVYRVASLLIFPGSHLDLRRATADMIRRPRVMETLYGTSRPRDIIPLLPDPPTDFEWTETTTWAGGDYIKKRGKWAGGIEARALNEVLKELGSRTRVNFLSFEHNQIFATELNSTTTNAILLLLRGGHFQLLLPFSKNKQPKQTPNKNKQSKFSKRKKLATTREKERLE